MESNGNLGPGARRTEEFRDEIVRTEEARRTHTLGAGQVSEECGGMDLFDPIIERWFLQEPRAGSRWNSSLGRNLGGFSFLEN